MVAPIQDEGRSSEPAWVHELFEQQAAQTPHAPAAVAGAECLTYRELNERANLLAHRLLRMGAGPDVLIGLYLDRSVAQLVGILGILKAGAAYVPLDLTHPADRLAFILEDTRAPLLLTRTGLLPALPPHEAKTVCLDDPREPPDAVPRDNPGVGAAGDDLAYVLYTSGSTGRPKGVMMSHSGLANYLSWCARSYPVGRGAGAPVHSPLSFDLTVTSLFAPLLAGRPVHLIPDGLDVDGFVAALRSGADFSLVKITPAHLEILARNLSPDEAGRLTHSFIIGGENLTYAQIAFWQSFAPATVLINEYGPTEAAVGCCVYQVPPGEQAPGSVPSGRPIGNTRLYVLGADLRPVSPGEPGELFIAGASLARGYLGRPDLTAKQFLPDAFGHDPGGRMYRTGDIVRARPDGHLEFLGRNDEQVKIRGYRVELAEIETTLAQHPDIGSTIVVARRGHSGVERLAAYAVLRPGCRPEPGTLRQFLRDRLPAYMVPASVQFLDALPLTGNGKVDRGALPAPGRTDFAVSDTPAPPRDIVEDRMIRVWQRVLGIRNIGVRDAFTDLGGDSLSALRLVTEIERAFGTRFPPATLFTEGTIERIVKVLDGPGTPDRPLVALRPGGAHPPFFLVHAIGGEVLSYAALARHMAPDQPFYGLQARTFDADRSGPTSVEELAADYLEEVRTVQPEGPYFLGGFSFGGTVAYEMAQQLRARGEHVALLVVVDQEVRRPERRAGWSRLREFAEVLVNLPFWVRYDLLRTGAGAMLTRLRVKVRGLARKVVGCRPVVVGSRSGAGVDHLFDTARLPVSHVGRMERHYRAWLNYAPRPYPGRVILIKARAQPLLRSGGHDLGWGRLATAGVRTSTVPGSHDNVLAEPYVRSLARRLDESLRAARAEAAAGRPGSSQYDHVPKPPDGGDLYRVVINSRGQFSIWPAGRENAAGWTEAGFRGTQDECLAHIRETWTDLRPCPESVVNVPPGRVRQLV